MKVTVQSISCRREADPELGNFVYAVAVLEFVAHEGAPILLQELKSGGLGDVDGDEAHFAEIEGEQRQELETMLRGLGLLDEADRQRRRDEALLQIQHVAYDGLLGEDAERIDQGRGTEAEKAMYAKLGRVNNIAEGCEPDEDWRPLIEDADGDIVSGGDQRIRAGFDQGKPTSTIRAAQAAREIAQGVPREDEWRSAASFMEHVCGILDGADVPRPDHYADEWCWS